MPTGPSSSKSVLASAAPNCTEASAQSTRSGAGTDATVATGIIERWPPGTSSWRTPFAGSTPPSRSWTSMRCGRTRRRCSLAPAAGRFAWRSKSVRCRPLLSAILERDPGFRGLMTFTLAESLWLHEHGFRDLLLAYPTADRAGLAQLGRLEAEGAPIVMVDSTEQLDLIDAAAGPGRRPIRLCIELDLAWWPAGGRIKIGARRSPVRTPPQARALAAEIVRRPGFELAGLMGYEAHIAGLGDRPLTGRWQGPAIRSMQAPLGRRDRGAPRGGGGRGARGGAHRAGQRRRHRAASTPPHASRRDRDHGGVRLLRTHALRPLRRLHPDPGRDVRAARGATPERRRGHAARRRLPRVGARRSRSPAGAVPARPGCTWTRARAPARCRPRCWAAPPLRSASATGSTSGTPRRASSASASTGSTS